MFNEPTARWCGRWETPLLHPHVDLAVEPLSYCAEAFRGWIEWKSQNLANTRRRGAIQSLQRWDYTYVRMFVCMYVCRCSGDSATVNADSLHQMPAGVLSKCLSCHDARCLNCTNPLKTPCRKGSNTTHTHTRTCISIRIAKIADND